jgi:hypothetical protein
VVVSSEHMVAHTGIGGAGVVPTEASIGVLKLLLSVCTEGPGVSPGKPYGFTSNTPPQVIFSP